MRKMRRRRRGDDGWSTKDPGPRANGFRDHAERLTPVSNQLEFAVEVSSSLQAQHTAAQSTISALESKVTLLEALVRTSHA